MNNDDKIIVIVNSIGIGPYKPKPPNWLQRLLLRYGIIKQKPVNMDWKYYGGYSDERKTGAKDCD